MSLATLAFIVFNFCHIIVCEPLSTVGPVCENLSGVIKRRSGLGFLKTFSTKMTIVQRIKGDLSLRMMGRK